MLLQLENTNQENVNKLLAFARQNQLELTLVDDGSTTQNHLPGKPLDSKQLTQLIEKSRQSGVISMEDAHSIVRKNYNAD